MNKGSFFLLIFGSMGIVAAILGWNENSLYSLVFGSVGFLFLCIFFASLGSKWTPGGRVPVRRRLAIAVIGILVFLLSPLGFIPILYLSGSESLEEIDKLRNWDYPVIGSLNWTRGTTHYSSTQEEIISHGKAGREYFWIIIVVWSAFGAFGLFMFAVAVVPDQSKSLKMFNETLS